MTTKEFKRVARILKESYKELEADALSKGIDIFSDEYKALMDKTREVVLAELGFTVEEYREIKGEYVSANKKKIEEKLEAKIAEVNDTINNLPKPVIPTKEEIQQLAREVAEEFIKPPIIKTEIVKEITHEVIKEKPQITEITKHTSEKYNDKPLRKEIEKLFKRIDNLKLPKEVDVEKIKGELFKSLQIELDKNINIMGMPDFRKLAMGLQEQIDDIKTNDSFNPVDYIQFNTSHTPHTSAPGLIQWNSTDGTYDMGLLNDSVLQVGQETMFYGKASGAISNGDLCEFAGVQGDHILIKKAVGSEIEANPHYMVGVATQNIADGTFGYVTWFGKVNNVYTKTPANQDTADWTAGDVLYFNVTTGQMTKTMPSAPNRVISVAAVIKEQTGASETGIIIVRPTLGMRLQDLDDVDGSPLVRSGQIPIWNDTGQYFDFEGDVDLGNHTLTCGGTQAGQSTIASGLVVNDSGGNTAADDFRAETVSNANAFVVDASADEVIIGVDTKIGTTNSNAKLNVQSTGTDDILNLFETGGTEVMTVLESGNVGIGTTNPGATLDILGGSSVYGFRVLNNSSGAIGGTESFLAQNTNSAGQAAFIFKNDASGYNSYGGMIYGGSTQATAGLFGTANRKNKLFLFADGGLNQGMYVGTLFPQPFVIGTNNAERLRIDSSGNVGIGTTAPDKKLEINSADGNNLRLTYNDSNGSATNYVDFLVSSTGDLTITPSGGDVNISGSINAVFYNDEIVSYDDDMIFL